MDLPLAAEVVRAEVGTPPEAAAEAVPPHESLEAALAETRKHGLSRSLGPPIPGIDALCAPVFDSEGHIVLGILVMGPAAKFDSRWDGAIAIPLRKCALEISRRIGRDETASPKQSVGAMGS